jgi:hypothetical protein
MSGVFKIDIETLVVASGHPETMAQGRAQGTPARTSIPPLLLPNAALARKTTIQAIQIYQTLKAMAYDSSASVCAILNAMIYS